MGFSRQEYWSGLPFPPPGDLPNPGTEPVLSLLHWQVSSLPLAPSGYGGNFLFTYQLLLFLKFFGCALQHVGSYFLDQGLNLCPLHWRRSLNHCTAREAPGDNFL